MDLRPQASRWGTLLLRLMLVLSMTASLAFGSTTSMNASHARIGIQDGQIVASAVPVADCPKHKSNCNKNCAQDCCVTVCSLCAVTLASLVEGLKEPGLGRKIRFVTVHSAHSGIDIGLDPPPPRVEA